MNVVFRQRKSTRLAYLPNTVECRVEKYSKKAVGGCKEATLTLKAVDRRDLYDLLNWLMVQVEIADNGRPVWWGYVARVEVRDGPIRATADIDTLSNRVAVAYTTVAYGEASVGARMTTDWLQDTASVNEFGIKELLDGRGGTTTLLAEALRARLLAQKAFPTAFFENNPDSTELSATVTCRGWWDTLSWRYATVPTRLALAYETIGSLTQKVGATDVVALGQSFDVGAAINLQDIDVHVGRSGTPPNDLTLGIFENPDDLTPGEQLASTTIAAAAVASTPGWIRARLSSALALAAGGTYFLVVSTSGLDAANYYNILLDGSMGYGAGVLRKRIGTTWSEGPEGDMPFRLYSNDLIETTQQIKAMIANFGQFLKNVYLDVASGISTESYRNGDADAQVEIEDLLDSGNSDNRRMFADVDIERRVRIFEQPPSSDYVLMNREGKFTNASGGDLDAKACPVGMWVMPSGIVPSNVDMSLLLGVQAFLVEEMEYDVSNDRLNPTPANIENPWDLGVSHG